MLLLAAVVVLIWFGPARAGDYGRIKGRVVDAQTLQPVVGAAIEVEGTDFGATSDENGEYLVPAVPGGVQSLLASAVGFEPARVTSVLVIVDQTIAQNFKLKSTVIRITTPVEAKATRAITPTQTSTARAMTTAEFGKMPITSLAEIVSLQAGVVNEPSRGMHLRGGRPDEIAYYVDGVATNDPIYGYQAARVNPEATAEVIVISGGFDAEYGEAMSGVVQVITKEGREGISGRAKYTTDQFLPQAVNFGYNQIEASLGGGGKIGASRLGFFVSPEVRLIGDYSPRHYRLPHQDRNDMKLSTKLTFSVPSGTKLTASGFAAREQWEMQPNGPDDENYLGFKYNLDHFLSQRNRLTTADVALDHMFSKDFFLSLRVGYFHDQRVQAVRDLAREATERDFKTHFWQDYIFKAEDSVFANDSVIKYMQGYYNEQKNDNCLNPYGVNRLYYGTGDFRVFLANWSTVYTLKGDLTYNLKKTHEFKTGIEIRQNYLSRRYNSLPWASDPFYDLYDLKPRNAAAYIQDRIDLDDLVIRAGLRLDYLDPEAYYLRDYTDKEDTNHVQAALKYKLSPRLGVSFPFSEHTKFRFSYGHFFQTPAYRYLFETISEHIIRGNQIIGNPDLSAQQTVAYELGLETELSRVFSMDFTAYYKDIYDLIGARYQSGIPWGYYPLENEEYGNVRGFEITFTKNLSSLWSSHLAYSLSMARGTASYFTEWYYERYRYGIDPVTGREMEPPKRDYFLDFDERHNVRGDVSFEFPQDFTVGLLRDLRAALLLSYGSGLPYSVRELKQGLNSGRVLGEKFSARMPPRSSVDGRVSKAIRFGKLAINLVCDVTNLLNTENIEWVYGFTGKPDDDGYAATFSPANWAGNVPITVTSGSAYHPARDLDHDGYITPAEEYIAYKAAYKDFVNNPNNFGPPREVRLGLSLEF
jgi:hypothetical protein